MRIATFRGEKSVRAIARKVYANLTPRLSRRAEEALLEANPQLASLRDVAPGSVLRVPELPELRVKAGRGPEDPADEVTDLVRERLDAYAKRLAERHEVHAADLKAQAALLRDRELRRLQRTDPALAERAKQLAGTLSARAKAARSERKQVEAAIDELEKDLARR